jgi:hypothetical protein
MNRFQLLFSYSPWFILACLAVGALYAVALYQKNNKWSPQLNRILAACRFVLVSLLCFLLLSPFVKQIKNTFEKPTVIVALDNSQSITLAGDSTQVNQTITNVRKLTTQLAGKDVNVEVQVFDRTLTPNQITSQLFTARTTNLSSMLGTIQSNYENRNLAGVVLISDGIYNQGISPEFQPYNFPIYTVGLGDTIPRRDINLKAVYYNTITYIGNQFPIVAEVHGIGFGGKVVNVQLKQNNKVLATKPVSFRNDMDVQEITFYTSASAKGTQHYVVEVTAQPEEFTRQNNSRDAYIEVIDGKEKILMLAMTPHPDIKAIKSALEKNENYQFESVIVGTGAPKEAKYDLIILHQIPDLYNSASAAVGKYLEGNTPVWYIVGSQSNISQFNTLNPMVQVTARSGQVDQVFPSFNPNFNIFKFEGQASGVLEKMPPVSVPFGEFRLTPTSEVILYQRVGNLVTNKPLLVVQNDKNRKSAVMLGEGLWEWRLEEYNLTESHQVVDEIITKLVQYLSAKEDKRKLRVYPISDEFMETDQVVFEAETYNNIYERIYNQKINLEVANAENKVSRYTFTNTEADSRFEISGLPKGVYHYKATAQVQGKNEQVTGEFTIKDQQLEALSTTADHNLLRKLATQTNGRFYLPNQLDSLAAQLINNPPPDRVQSSEETMELIHLKWLFFVLLLLATAEWGIRKYQGSY